MDRMCQMLHTKSEDIRIHNFADEEHPELLEDEEETIGHLGFEDNHKLLIESELHYDWLRSQLRVCTACYVMCV